jgi:hypothetical protein
MTASPLEQPCSVELESHQTSIVQPVDGIVRATVAATAPRHRGLCQVYLHPRLSQDVNEDWNSAFARASDISVMIL